MKILLIEDEKKVANFIQQGLSETGFEIDVASDGEIGLQMIHTNAYDVIILDWLLPGKSGIEVCREIRKLDASLPVLMLTAKDTIDDKVVGLESGADDYLTKPFAFEELIARIRALYRRKQITLVDDKDLVIEDLRVNPITRKVYRGGEEIFLSTKEFELLLYFLRHKNRIITRKMLAEAVWKIDFDTGTNFVEVYINYLRKKLDTGSRKPLILTIRGAGYIMKEESGENN